MTSTSESNNEIEMIEAGTLTDKNRIIIVKTLFQREGIPFHAQGDQSVGNARPPFIRFLVPKQFQKRAAEIIDAF